MSGLSQRRCRYYNIQDTIGAGNFAEVKKCTHVETGQAFAIKVIEKKRVDPKRRDKILESECDALRRVQHPNIVALHEIFDTPEKLYIVMEVRAQPCSAPCTSLQSLPEGVQQPALLLRLLLPAGQEAGH